MQNQKSWKLFEASMQGTGKAIDITGVVQAIDDAVFSATTEEIKGKVPHIISRYEEIHPRPSTSTRNRMYFCVSPEEYYVLGHVYFGSK